MSKRQYLPIDCNGVIKKQLGIAILLAMPFTAYAQIEISSTKNSPEPPVALGTPEGDQSRGLIEDVPTALQPDTSNAKKKVQSDPEVGTVGVEQQKATPSENHRLAQRAQGNKAVKTKRVTATPSDGSDQVLDATAGIERVLFKHAPVRVSLKTGQERILHFPNPVVLHLPEGEVTLFQPLDVIDRTIYITATTAFPRIRAIVEDLTTGQMIPLDLQSSNDAIASSELQIFTAPIGTGPEYKNSIASDENEGEHKVDMVTLTRYASRMLYAPRRLMPQIAGIQQVKVTVRPVIGLYPRANIETTPIGAWRSEDLFVTAVKFVNRGKTPIDIALDEMRGRWVSVTAQHGRLGPAGSEEDTTAVYLVSERPFEESR